MKINHRIEKALLKVCFHYNCDIQRAREVITLTFEKTKDYVHDSTDMRQAVIYIYRYLKKSLEPQHDFDAEVVSLQKDIYGFALYLTKDKELALDLRQNTMVKALLNKDKFRPGPDYQANLKSWLLRITHNTFTSEMRHKEIKHRLTPKYDDTFTQGETIDYEAIMKTLGNGRMKKVVELRSKGYRVKEVAKELNITESMVRNDNHLARQILRGKYGDY